MRTLITLVFSTLLLFFLFSYLPIEGIGQIDLLQYWAASKIFLYGGNPYDPKSLEVIQRITPVITKLPVIMWNPPALLTFIFPLAFLTFEVATKLFLALSISIIGFCALTLMNLAIEIDKKSLRLIAILFSVSFPPFLLCIYYGQISFLLLLGLTIFLLRVKEKENLIFDDFKGGILLSLTTIKPHLLFLPYTFLLIGSIKNKKYGSLKGVLLGTFVLSILPMIWDKNIYSYYLEALNLPPINWKTPTVGSWFQALTNIHTPFVRLCPTFLAAIGAALFFFRKNIDYFTLENFLFLIPFSLIFSPYGWGYDQMLLLPLILSLINRSKIATASLLLMNVIPFLSPETMGQEYLIWYPLGVLIAGIASIRSKRIC